MQFPIISRRKAATIANGIFLILLGIITYTETWWPGLIIAIGINVAIRQFFSARKTDLYITLAIIGIIAAFSFLNMTSTVFLALIFVAAGLYLILREYFFSDCLCLRNRADDKENGHERNEKQ